MPLSQFSAAVFKASSMPLIPSVMGDRGHPILDLADRGLPTVGIMSMEPASCVYISKPTVLCLNLLNTLCRYYPIASEKCRHANHVEMLMSPSYTSTVPLPYFSWKEHPLNLPTASDTEYDGPPDKVPGALPLPLATVATKQNMSAVWIASNCKSDNWRRQLCVLSAKVYFYRFHWKV